jgi:hypothetical protein
MNQWSSAKAKRVLAARLRIGWSIKRESSSHKILSRLVGLMSSLHFTIEKKLDRGCWRVLQKIRVLNQGICDEHF